MLRTARGGGLVSAYRVPGVDSVLFRTSFRAPALERVIAFGAEDGFLAAVDQRGSAVRVDLRLGTVNRSADSLLRTLSSADGTAIYALTSSGTITRFTPSGGEWSVTPTLPASTLFAQADGSLIVAGAIGKRVVVWRIRPPEPAIVDTLAFDVGGTATANAAMIAATALTLSDRIVFGAHESVIAVRSRDMKPALNLDLGDPIRAIEATPSGDRLFVALDDDRKLRVVDRFEEEVSGKIALPAQPRALRMDPLGRGLLAQGGGDSVFVVSLASDAVVATVRSDWRADLPLVLADGTLVLARGDDAVITTPAMADGRTILRGGLDFWQGIRWNGFRPRAEGLDQPVNFRMSAPRDSMDRGDSVISAVNDSSTATGAPGGSTGVSANYMVTFASIQSESQARALASKIRVDGQAPRISPIDRRGTVIYRVELGPFATREEATRVGRASGQSYWITEGTP